jgi:hypothetical protein
VHASVQQLDEEVECLEPDAGVALGQNVRAQRHRGSNHGNRQRLAHAGGMAAQQVDLQLRQRVVRDLHVGKAAEARVDAVGRRVVIRELVDDSTRREDTRTRLLANRNRRICVRDSDQLVESQRVTVEFDHGRQCTSPTGGRWVLTTKRSKPAPKTASSRRRTILVFSHHEAHEEKILKSFFFEIL